MIDQTHNVPDFIGKEACLQEAAPIKISPKQGWGGILSAVLAGRRNLLAIWPERAYKAKTFSVRLLNQPYFICNSPDTVRRVFLD